MESMIVLLLRAAISSVVIGSPKLIFRNSSTTNSGGTLRSTSTSARAFDLNDIIHWSSREQTSHETLQIFLQPTTPIFFRTLPRLEINVFWRFCLYFSLFYCTYGEKRNWLKFLRQENMTFSNLFCQGKKMIIFLVDKCYHNHSTIIFFHFTSQRVRKNLKLHSYII